MRNVTGRAKCATLNLVFCFALLLKYSLLAHSLSVAPPTTSSSETIASPSLSWTVPRNVKFGKLSNLILSPNGEDDKKQMNDDSSNEDGSQQTIRVATSAIGLNFADVFTVLGLYKAANLVRGDSLAPFVPGIEFAGAVLDDGGGFRRGDRVFGFTRFGAYSDVVHAKPDFIRKIPKSWSFEQGAAFLVNALTAWHGLVNVGGMPNLNERKLDEKKPYVVVVHSASGGVGLWASEIAARRGAIVVGVVGSEEKKKAFFDRVDTLCNGAAQCIVRSNSARNFDSELAEACQKARSSSLDGGSPVQSSAPFSTCLEAAEAGCGADLVMECYGGKYFQPSMDIINPGGSLSTYGATTYNDSGVGEGIPFLSLLWNFIRRPRVDPGSLTGRNIRVGGFNLIFLTENIDMLVESLDGCVECLCKKDDDSRNDFDIMMERVNPPLVGSIFSFREVNGNGGAVNALKALRSGNTVGKVVLDNSANPTLMKSWM